MARKTKMANENESYILPSLNDEMRSFIKKFKVDMMEHIIKSIKFAVDNKLSIVEVFQFKNSPFVVTINENEFNINLSHIKKYYKENEMYELCPGIDKLQEILKRKPNEKKESDSNDGFNHNI